MVANWVQRVWKRAKGREEEGVLRYLSETELAYGVEI